MDSNIISTLIGSDITLISILGTIAAIRLTAKNDRGTHISKTRFDKEFEIYQELSEKNLSSLYVASETILIVNGLYNDEPEQIKKHLEKLCVLMNDAGFSNKKYASFIDKEIYQNYKEFHGLIKDIFTMFRYWVHKTGNNLLYKGETYTYSDVLKYIEEKQKEASNLSYTILDNIRVYLKGLDVIK